MIKTRYIKVEMFTLSFLPFPSPVLCADPPENCHLNVKKLPKNDNFCQFFWKNVKFLAIFLTFKWQISGGSGANVAQLGPLLLHLRSNVCLNLLKFVSSSLYSVCLPVTAIYIIRNKSLVFTFGYVRHFSKKRVTRWYWCEMKLNASL